MTKKPSELFENYDTSVFKEVTTPKTRKVKAWLILKETDSRFMLQSVQLNKRCPDYNQNVFTHVPCIITYTLPKKNTKH